MDFEKKSIECVLSTFEDTAGFFRLSAQGEFDISHFMSAEKEVLDRQINLLKSQHPVLNFERSDYDDVHAFFQEASKDYDSDLANPHWAFTHDILKFILTKFITGHFQDARTIRLFDAGAGTGNWSQFVLGLRVGLRGIMFDMNAHMLRVARPKLARTDSQVRIIEGNLETPSDFPSEKSNLLLCMHNVVGLARNTDAVLHNLCSYLEDDGLAFIMAMNKYHALNFVRRFRSQVEVLRVWQDGTVKFKNEMPEMFCYTPTEFELALRAAGFSEVKVLGFPVTVYPSVQDAKLLTKNTSVFQLKDCRTRAKLLNLEKRPCLCPELAYRGGSSLIAICKKTSHHDIRA